MNQNQNLSLKHLSLRNCFSPIPRACAIALSKKALLCSVLTIGILAVGTFMCDQAHAATATTDALSGAYTSVKGIVTGSFTRIVTAVSLVFGLLGCALKFNPMAIVSCFGVGITAAVGPAAVETLVSALF